MSEQHELDNENAKELDYFEQVGLSSQQGKNRAKYKQILTASMEEKGYDHSNLDMDYLFDEGNNQGKDLTPAVKKNDDGKVTEDLLLDMSTVEGFGWAAASKVLYDKMHKKNNETLYYPGASGNWFMPQKGLYTPPETAEEFAQWGIETAGFLNYNLPQLGIDTFKINRLSKKDPEAAFAFQYLMKNYGKLPMLTSKGTKRFFNGVVKDPTTWVGLGTLGFGLIGKKFAKIKTKNVLMQILNKAIDPTMVSIYEGAMFAGLDDYFKQSVGVNMPQGVEGYQDGYDFGQMATAAGMGGGASAALAGTGHVVKEVAPHAVNAGKKLITHLAEGANKRIAEEGTGTKLHSNPIGPMIDKTLSAAGKFAVGDGQPPSNRNIDLQGFYSKAEEALNTITQQKGTGKQFINQLKNQFSVKERELYWLGLDKFDNDTKVTKQELINTIKDNYVQIKEHKFLDTNVQDTETPIGRDISFNLSEDVDAENWLHRVDDFIDEFERGQMDEMEIDSFVKDLGFLTQEELNSGRFINITEDDRFNGDAVRQAISEGNDTYINFNGDEVNFRSELEENFEDLAKEIYMEDPYMQGSDTLGLGYSIHGNDGIGYYVTAPDGTEVVSDIYNLGEAQVHATSHAYDHGHILDPIDEGRLYDDLDDAGVEVDGGSVSDPSILGGTPRWKSHKIDGGTNYREFVLENSSFKGDPEQEQIFTELTTTFEKLMNNLDEGNYLDNLNKTYENLPDSEKARFLTNNNYSSEKEFFKKLYTNKEEHNTLNKLRTEQLEKYNLNKDNLGSDANNKTINALAKFPMNIHYSINNMIGHVRVTDRVGADGSKYLYVEEMQSDWSQRNRDAMIKPENFEKLQDINRKQKQYDELNEKTEKAVNDLLENNTQLLTDNFDNYKRTMLMAIRGIGAEEQPLKELSALFDKIDVNDFAANFKNNVETQLKNNAEVFADVNELNSLMGSVGYMTLYDLIDGDTTKLMYNPSSAIDQGLGNSADLKPLVDAILPLIPKELGELGTFLRSDKTLKFKGQRQGGAVPRGPFVTQTADTMELQLKTLLRRAVDEGYPYVVLSGPEDQVKRWGESKREGMEKAYGEILPNVANKLIKKFDKKAKTFKASAKDLGLDGVSLDGEMVVIPITDEMRESVKKGMSLFEAAGITAGGGTAVAGSQMVGQENEDPGI